MAKGVGAGDWGVIGEADRLVGRIASCFMRGKRKKRESIDMSMSQDEGLFGSN